MSKVEPHFKAILKLVASGMSIEAALRSRPEFPIKATWKAYAYDKRFPTRRQQIELAAAAGKAVRKARGWTVHHCTEEDYSRALLIVSSSDPAVPIYKLDFGNLPGWSMLYRRSQTDKAFGKRFAAAKGGRQRGGNQFRYSDDVFAAAISEIKTGSLVSYAEKNTGPSHSALWRRAKRQAGFASEYRTAVQSRWNRNDAGRNGDDLYDRVSKAVPRRLDPDAREDVISDIVEAVLSGQIAESEIAARCGQYVTAHNRMFSPFKSVSLDAPIYDDRSYNMLDSLTTDPAHAWGM